MGIQIVWMLRGILKKTFVTKKTGQVEPLLSEVCSNKIVLPYFDTVSVVTSVFVGVTGRKGQSFLLFATQSIVGFR